MAGAEKEPTEAMKKAIAFLKRSRPNLDAWWIEQCRLEAEQQKATREKAVATEAEMVKNACPGQAIEGKGVFLGVWEPKDRDGQGLGKKFNVFAAPQDLINDAGERALVDFNKAAQQVATLKNWYGFDGEVFTSDTALYESLRKGSYRGGWFIPPLEILDGRTVDRDQAGTENLYQHKENGALKNTFVNISSCDDALWYASCTEPRDQPTQVWIVHFSEGSGGWSKKDDCLLSVRPVRLEPQL